jgi:DNA-binding transcriptional ArsR family regulator
VNYPRRQQYRRLSRAGTAATGTTLALGLAVACATVGLASLTAALVLIALGFGFNARHWLLLAGRSRVGARSEEEVRRILRELEAEGWRVRHSLRWRGRGDIDSVAIAPSGIAFVIETKTSRYDSRHLDRVREQAVWLSRRRRRWCRSGAVPVLCVVRARGERRWEDGVLVLSIEHLTRSLELASNAGGWSDSAPIV